MRLKENDRVILYKEYMDLEKDIKAIIKYCPRFDTLFFEFDEPIPIGHEANNAGKVGCCQYGHNERGTGKVLECNCGKCLICCSKILYNWIKL